MKSGGSWLNASRVVKVEKGPGEDSPLFHTCVKCAHRSCVSFGDQDKAIISMAHIRGNKLSREREAGSRDRKPEPLARSDRLVRSGMRLHPRDGMDSMTQSRFSTPPHSQARFTPHRPSQATWEFSRQTFFPSDCADSWNAEHFTENTFGLVNL